MNSDFRMGVDFRTHPKWVKLYKRLGAEGCLALVALYGFAAAHKPDGILSGLDGEDIAIATLYPGDQDQFVDMLIELRLLERPRQCTRDP